MLFDLLLAAAIAHAARDAPSRTTVDQVRRDYMKVNVCDLVPGDAIARALGGKLVQVRSTPDTTTSRCTYFIIPGGASSQLGYVLWLQAAEDFEGLKKYIEEPLTPLSGLGDGAYMFQDKGDGRFKINVLKRGDLMFQATGETAERARKVADAAWAILSKKTP
jgi:hypothetical protein